MVAEFPATIFCFTIDEMSVSIRLSIEIYLVQITMLEQAVLVNPFFSLLFKRVPKCSAMRIICNSLDFGILAENLVCDSFFFSDFQS